MSKRHEFEIWLGGHEPATFQPELQILDIFECGEILLKGPDVQFKRLEIASEVAQDRIEGWPGFAKSATSPVKSPI